jgi:cytochrome c-type biogenesis protein CcmH
MNKIVLARRLRIVAALCVATASSAAAVAQAQAPAGSAPGAQDKASRIRELEEGFRCVVCQNQTLADSNAELAGDLRGKIVEQVERGATDAQVRDYMVQRYGDFVLYKPPVKPLTWLLWFGPFALLGLGAFVLVRIVACRRVMHARPLTGGERRRVDALLSHASEDVAP